MKNGTGLIDFVIGEGACVECGFPSSSETGDGAVEVAGRAVLGLPASADIVVERAVGKGYRTASARFNIESASITATAGCEFAITSRERSNRLNRNGSAVGIFDRAVVFLTRLAAVKLGVAD